MNFQRIERDGQVFAQILLEDFEALLEDRQMLQDIQDYDRAVAQVEEFIPLEMTLALQKAFQADKSVIPIWREYRDMTQVELAKKSDIPQSYLSDIETGKKPGSKKAIISIAKALDISIDDLIL